MARSTVYVLLAVPLLLSQGCMLATQQDLVKLDNDLIHLRKNQADLVTKMTELNGNLEALNSQLESSQQRMTTLSQKMDDLQADLSRRLNVLTGHVTGTSNTGSSNPSDIYRLAYNDYQAGKIDLALVGFRNFLAQFPKSELSAQAQFQVGECEYARKNYLDAAREYDKVYDLYPKSDLAPKALYKKGVAYQQIGKRADAQDAFRHLLKEYPRSELAKPARDSLNQ